MLPCRRLTASTTARAPGLLQRHAHLRRLLGLAQVSSALSRRHQAFSELRLSRDIEIFKLDLQSNDHDLPVVGEWTSSERFNRLSWSKPPAGSQDLFWPWAHRCWTRRCEY